MPAINFNTEDESPRQAFDPIPAAWYQAVITESEEKPTKKGDGSYVQLTFEIIEGEYKGRLVWARLNLNNPNDQAVGIARADLAAIAKAVGKRSPKSTEDLHNLPLLIKVTVRRAEGDYEAGNEIKGYKSVTESVNTPTAPAASKPWERKK